VTVADIKVSQLRYYFGPGRRIFEDLFSLTMTDAVGRMIRELPDKTEELKDITDNGQALFYLNS
jgi:hypothetical protein